MHVDEFIDNYKLRSMEERYARWVLQHMRLRADLQEAFEPFMKEHKLFCTYSKDHKRYQVTFASRFGSIRLYRHGEGYSMTSDVDIADCSDWGRDESEKNNEVS